MTTIDDIKSQLLTQNLSGLGFYSTLQFEDWFEKLSTPLGIDMQVSHALSISASKGMPIYYWNYDNSDDALVLLMKRFSYVNNSWVYLPLTHLPFDISWQLSPEKEYIITYPSNSKVGQAFNRNIPIVLRNL